MENVIYPNSMHLRLMLANCNVVTPLTYPHYNIDYPSEIILTEVHYGKISSGVNR